MPNFPYNPDLFHASTKSTPIKVGGVPSSFGGLQPDWEITDNGRGLLEGSAKFVFDHANKGNDADIPKMGTPHPADSRLLCWDVQTTYGKARIGYAQAKYIGIANGSMTRPEVSLSGSAAEQSIKFHPLFKEWEAEAANDVQKIKRDENGYFVSFGPKHEKVPALEQFVAPSGTCKVQYYCKSVAQWAPFAYGGLGKQCAKPPFAPDYLDASGSNLSWLLTSCNITEHGTIFKVESDYTLSTLGKPHNQYVYEALSVQ